MVFGCLGLASYWIASMVFNRRKTRLGEMNDEPRNHK
jgi:hypothetical protein